MKKMKTQLKLAKKLGMAAFNSKVFSPVMLFPLLLVTFSRSGEGGAMQALDDRGFELEHIDGNTYCIIDVMEPTLHHHIERQLKDDFDIIYL